MRKLKASMLAKLVTCITALQAEQSWKGQCYHVAADLAGVLGLTLVHGEPLGDGGEVKGVRYGHAWVEYGGLVIDATLDGGLFMPVETYYRLGNIVEADVRRYNPRDAATFLALFKHYGPWHGPFAAPPL